MSHFTTITPEDALKLMEENSEIIIVDIRPHVDFKREHVPRAQNLDYDGHHFQEKVEKLDKNKNYIIYCKSGVRGEYFMGKMRESGFSEVYNILGGFVAWKVSNLPITGD
jgi:rhodanese-related sulfurtransferase